MVVVVQLLWIHLFHPPNIKRPHQLPNMCKSQLKAMVYKGGKRLLFADDLIVNCRSLLGMFFSLFKGDLTANNRVFLPINKIFLGILSMNMPLLSTATLAVDDLFFPPQVHYCFSSVVTLLCSTRHFV